MENEGQNEVLVPELEQSQPETSRTVEYEGQRTRQSEVLAPELEQSQQGSGSFLPPIQEHGNYVLNIEEVSSTNKIL